MDACAIIVIMPVQCNNVCPVQLDYVCRYNRTIYARTMEVCMALQYKHACPYKKSIHDRSIHDFFQDKILLAIRPVIRLSKYNNNNNNNSSVFSKEIRHEN